MDIGEIVTIALILFLGSILQSVVGFAFALFAIPLVVWVGISLPNTLAIVGTSAFLQAVFGTKHLYADVPWKSVIFAMILRVPATLGGLLILHYLSTLSAEHIKFIVGCLLCGIVGLRLIWNVKPVESLHPLWGLLAFSSSGLLAGSCGMGGFPLVVWATSHNWTTGKIRGFLFAIFVGTLPIQLIMLYITFGHDVIWGFVVGGLLSFCVVGGTSLGLALGNRIPPHILRTIAYILLLMIALHSMIPQLISVLF